MGMTDVQFKQYSRLQLRILKEAKEQKTKEEMEKKIETLIQDIQQGLED